MNQTTTSPGAAGTTTEAMETQGRHSATCVTPCQVPDAQATTPRTRAQAFSALIQADISHGAFRLWHCLYDHLNPKTGLCCPSYDTIANEIHCNLHSILRWLEELEDNAWLVKNQVKRKAQNSSGSKRKPKGNQSIGVSNRYTLLDGQGELLLKRAVAGTAKKRSRYEYRSKQQYSNYENSSTVLPESAVKLIPFKKWEKNELSSALAPSGSALRRPQGGAENNSVPGQPTFVKRGMR